MSKEKLQILQKTIKILDFPDYRKYSNNSASNYLEYMQGRRRDESKLIQPILFPKFLEEILEYSKGENIYCEDIDKGGNNPDFVPTDKLTHPWVFDTKGTDTESLHEHLSQIKRYIKAYRLKYGILVNMRDIDVYAADADREIEEFNFSFVILYQEFKGNKEEALKSSNTKKFLSFIDAFKHRNITANDKIDLLSKMPLWTGLEELNTDNLTIAVRKIKELLFQDVLSKKNEILSEIISDDRKITLRNELVKIAEEIGYEFTSGQAKYKLTDFLHENNPASELVKATNVYLYRTAYFCLTRILLARMWGDIGFIDRNVLYNGDFKECYEYVKRSIRAVLEQAFNYSSKKYSWLFANENNYSWYAPTEDILIDTLFILADFHLGKLDKDILGSIYENYIDLIDKKKKGQYYTPHQIVSMIWDLVGYNSSDDMFLYEGNKRKAKKVLDVATGSGSFLVEAIRRLREKAGLNMNDFQDVLDLRSSIISGYFGSEITAFAYYITEVNLLIQLTPVVKRMIDLKPIVKEYPYCLGVLQNDSLQLHNNDQNIVQSLSDAIEENRIQKITYKATHDIIIGKDKAKQKIFDLIKNSKDFYYCCSNPPYIGEDDNKELFRNTREMYPYWNNFYQGKMDYLYWFVILGISKLINGGKLGFITTSYWVTADGATKLRKYILETTSIKTLIFFGEIKLFEHAKGQHSMVFILEKEGDPENRKNNKIKIVQIIKKPENNYVSGVVDFLTSHIMKNIQKPDYADEYIKVYTSGMSQGELSEDAWYVCFSSHDKQILNQLEKNSVRLVSLCDINQGYVSGAHKVTSDNIDMVPKNKIVNEGIKLGDGIFVLNNEEYKSLKLHNQELIKKTIKNSNILRYVIDDSEYEYLIYIEKNTKIDNYPKIKKHLEKYQEILSHKRETMSGKLPWYSLHWARTNDVFDAKKIIVPYRAKTNTFAYDDKGYYGSTDMYFINLKPSCNYDIKYILGILNSRALDYWCGYKIKRKGEVREYFPTPLENIPIPKTDLTHVKGKEIHDKVVLLVEEIIEASKEQIRLKNAEIDTKKIPIRIHPKLEIEAPETNILFVNNCKITEKTLFNKFNLIISCKSKEKIIISSKEKDYLDYINNAFSAYSGKAWDEVKEELLIPIDIDDYSSKEGDRQAQLNNLQNSIEKCQNKIDEMVYKLYGLTEEGIRVMEGASPEPTTIDKRLK